MKISFKGFFSHAWDYLIITLGCFIYAAAINLFIKPHGIMMGGITGISLILNRILGTPVGIVIILLNIPLFFLGLKMIGGKFLALTIYATVFSSLLIDLTAPIFTPLGDDTLIAAIFGGVLIGFALGLIFSRNGSTGGSDIAGRLLRLKFEHLSMGRLVLLVDLTIIICGALTVGTLDAALYAIISLFLSSMAIDAVLFGFDKAKLAMVITNERDKLAEIITTELKRGVTVIEGRGAYSHTEKGVLLCAARVNQIAGLKKLVEKHAPGSFIVVLEANEVLGQGFERRI